MKEVIPELLFEAAEKSKDTAAFNYFHHGWVTITYSDLLSTTKSIASYLMNTGIQKGDRIAILSENRHEWCTVYLAISLAGAVAVPIDAQLGPEEIKNLLADSESRVIFHSAKTRENLLNALNLLSSSFPPVSVNFDAPLFMDICRTPHLKDYPGISEDDIASLIYTSGTTGTPKGVLLTHKNFCSDAEAIEKIGIIAPGDNFISILPYHHTYPFMGNFILPLSLGLTITFPPSLKGPELLATIREKGVTILVGVPQLLELIRNGILGKIKQLPGPLPGIMLRVLKLCGGIRQSTGINTGKVIFKSAHRALGGQFRFFASGGAKLNPEVMQDLEALGFTLLEGYGLTETSPVVTFNSPRLKRKPGSIGKQLPSVEIKVISPETRKEAGIMEEGEIVIKGPMVMKGYYRNPQATEQVLKDGWFSSGDLGYRDQDGYIFVTGRLKEVIVLSSGKNIYPEEVEKQYLKVPLIKEICVMGIEEKGLVESLHAVVVPDFEYAKKAQIGNLQETLKWEINDVSLTLPPFMRIRGYSLHSDPLPRTPLGKLRRFMVKDLLDVKMGKSKVKREEETVFIEDPLGRKIVESIQSLLKEKIAVQLKDNLELDLGLDSLAKIELIVSLENAFSIKLPETFLADIQTVGELVGKIKEYGTVFTQGEEKPPDWKDILLTEPVIGDQKKVGLHLAPLEDGITLCGLTLLQVLGKLFFRLKAKGLENIPEKGPYIIAPNHTSYLDAFAVGAALHFSTFQHLYILGSQQYFSSRPGKIFARLAHVIPIDQETYMSKSLQMSSYVLINGKALMVFPEGGRSFDGNLLEFKKGVGILARELNIPVIPVYIKGAYQALPRTARRPKFTGIVVIFGKPLRTADIDFSKKPAGTDDSQFFANTLREKVRDLQELQ
ncbi:MAG: AMP-binding protein [Thermodesulfovibrionales bacterium]|nr:AMP-binding protein [Thermodesulfovibrionales bacterium]